MDQVKFVEDNLHWSIDQILLVHPWILCHILFKKHYLYALTRRRAGVQAKSGCASTGGGGLKLQNLSVRTLWMTV